ncbi:hypothetical protein SLA2020_390590 [Shorea laevis]
MAKGVAKDQALLRDSKTVLVAHCLEVTTNPTRARVPKDWFSSVIVAKRDEGSSHEKHQFVQSESSNPWKKFPW